MQQNPPTNLLENRSTRKETAEVSKTDDEKNKLVRHVTPLNPESGDQLVSHEELGDWPTVDPEPTVEEQAEAEAKKADRAKHTKSDEASKS